MQWQEAEAEVRQLQETEKYLQRQLAAAQAVAADQPALDNTTAGARATSVDAPAVKPQQEDQVPTMAPAAAPAAHLDARGLPACTGPMQAPAVAAATSADDIGSLQQQLRRVNAERLKKQRLVRLLKDAVPYSWDKRCGRQGGGGGVYAGESATQSPFDTAFGTDMCG